jgi:hypothetical protein
MRSVGWVGVGLVCCTVLVEVRGQQLAADIGPDWRTRPVLSLMTNNRNCLRMRCLGYPMVHRQFVVKCLSLT